MNTTNLSSVSVIVVTYNNSFQVDKLVETLNILVRKGAEVLLADNASVDKTFDKIIKSAPLFKPAFNKINVGFSKAVNMLLSKSHREYILLLNPDAFISP